MSTVVPLLGVALGGMVLGTEPASPTVTPATLPLAQQSSPPLSPPSPSRAPLSTPGPVPLPPDLLAPPEGGEPRPPESGSSTDWVCVVGFEVAGSSVFDPAELAAVAQGAVAGPPCVAPAQGVALSFVQLQQARDAITQRYLETGYLTSGAYIPEQTLVDGVVQLQVLEGRVSAIDVDGLERLNPDYVRDRLALAAQAPLSADRLLEGLQLLQLNPLIASIEAELAPGLEPGTNRLTVEVSEANPYQLGLIMDNGRSPLVGGWQRRLRGGHINLTGQGDALLVDYANTNGSNSVDLIYSYPLNARNGTLSLSHGRTSSWIIEDDFEVLDVQSSSRYYEITYRQPLRQTPTEEFALGLTLSREESESVFNPEGGEAEPFPSLGAGSDGTTRITPLRFTQDYLNRNSNQVLALRSQFSLGTGLFGVTSNPIPPDAYFLSWRGQGQWVKLLGPDSLLLLRSDMQLALDSLVPVEQIALGGLESVRGYRQDQLLTDNGIFASAEVRLPVARLDEPATLFQVVPFVDFGTGWNVDGSEPVGNLLLSTGIGLNMEMTGGLTARLDYGIPLLNTPTGNTLQESGLLFSIQYAPWP